mmetsp:Transcript_26554/g.42985  ORF Transcript_26554/g.42985 Transcript_26554/m.42985 type:complete len:83 (-) Transcript_26554:1777-2025(-)
MFKTLPTIKFQNFSILTSYYVQSLTVSWSNDPYLLEKSQAPVQDWKILLLSSKNYEIFRSLMEKMYQQVYQEVVHLTRWLAS